MNELSIAQIRMILGWSFPTALAWASKNGRMDGRKWMVPASIVYAELAARYQAVEDSRVLLSEYCPTYQPPAFA